MLLGFEGDSQPARNAELPRNVLEMCFDRSCRYGEALSDAPICQALHEKPRHVLLRGCQASPALANASVFLPGAASKPQTSHSGTRSILIAPGSDPFIFRESSLEQIETICSRAGPSDR